MASTFVFTYEMTVWRSSSQVAFNRPAALAPVRHSHGRGPRGGAASVFSGRRGMYRPAVRVSSAVAGGCGVRKLPVVVASVRASVRPCGWPPLRFVCDYWAVRAR